MGLSNLPDDWGSYYSTCTECGHAYHASGSVDCRCNPCNTCLKKWRENHPEDPHGWPYSDEVRWGPWDEVAGVCEPCEEAELLEDEDEDEEEPE